jgi:hypothetical protein
MTKCGTILSLFRAKTFKRLRSKILRKIIHPETEFFLKIIDRT